MATQDTHSLIPNRTPIPVLTRALKTKFPTWRRRRRHTAADWGRSAASAMDRNLQSAAGALENTASKLRERVPASGKVNEIATETADKFETTARYLREHDTATWCLAWSRWFGRNPGASLCAALAVGFLIGTALRRDHDDY